MTPPHGQRACGWKKEADFKKNGAKTFIRSALCGEPSTSQTNKAFLLLIVHKK
jgi:hypothetical protein